MTDKTKRIAKRAGLVAAAAWIVWITASTGLHRDTESARGLSSLGGGPITTGGGIAKVTHTGPLLTGSGTSGNPLAATVTAGSGLGSGGAETLYVSAGSGITADGTNTRVNEGSGLTWCSGAACTNAGSGLTYSSGALITNVGTGLSYSAGAIIVAVTGGTCSNGQMVTAVSSSGVVTCGNPSVNDYGGTHLRFVEECMAATRVTASNVGYGGWLSVNTMSGTSEQVSGNATGATTRPGICDMQDGTGNGTGVVQLDTGPTIDFASGSWDALDIAGWPTLSDGTNTYATVFGFLDTTTTIDQANGCFFLYDQGNVATGGPNSGNANKLSCWCSSASTRTKYLMDGSTVSDESFTTVNAPVAALTLPSTNILNLDVVMTGTTRAEFYIGGVKSCDINTHIPSGSSALVRFGAVHIKSVGAGSRSYYIDRLQLTGDLNSVRSP